MVEFTDENIRAMFGAEDAENETPARLKEYFFRNKAYDSLASDLPIRILVGHKGVGKSALLKIAYLEDLERETLALWLRPDDLYLMRDMPDDLNAMIDAWKKGLLSLIFSKVCERIPGANSDEKPTRLRRPCPP